MDPAALRARIEEHVRRHDLIPPGGDVACLVSGGPDSTCLWHVLGELGYRVSALHVEPPPARRGVGGGRPLLRATARRRGRRRAGRGPRARPSFATSATRSPPTGCARPATPPPTRSRRSSTASSRAGARPASACAATTASSGRSLPLARGDRGLLPRGGPALPRRLLQRGHEARPHPRRDPAAPAPAPPGRRAQPPARARGAAIGCRGRSSGRWPSCSPPGRARSGSTSAAAGWRCASTSSVWLERAPVPLDRPVRWGGWRSSRRARACSFAAGAPATGSPAQGKKVQDLFVDAKIPRSEREAWPLVVRGDDVVVVPGVAAAPGTRRRSSQRGARDELRSASSRARSRRSSSTRRRSHTGSPSSARRSPPTTGGRTSCSSASSRAPSSSSPTSCGRSTYRARSTSWRSRATARHRLVGRRAHPEGPRPVDRGAQRARRRGHRRLGAHALLPRPGARSALAGLGRGLRAADEARAARDRRPLPVRRLRDPAPAS